MITKRTFIAAAAQVNAIRQGDWTNEAPAWADADRYDEQADFDEACIWYTRAVQTAEAYIHLFADDNPRFDVNRFLVACGLQDAPIKTKRGKVNGV